MADARATGRIATLIRRIRRRWTTGGLVAHALGLWLRFRFDKAGIITLAPGWPPPEIDNHGGRIEVGNCGFFPGVRLECWPGARITIGNGTYLNRGVEIVAAQSVSLGEDCKIARDVIIMDTDQHEVPGKGLVASPVDIGPRVWIGARAIVLKGVTIGGDSIIGAGAIVTKSVPARSVVVGQAARVLRSLD